MHKDSLPKKIGTISTISWKLSHLDKNHYFGLILLNKVGKITNKKIFFMVLMVPKFFWSESLCMPPHAEMCFCSVGSTFFSKNQTTGPMGGSFSKNAPYKQKIIFHIIGIDKMS